jgi:hypothetical protein
LYGRSLAQVNYVYRELPSRSFGMLFHAYLPKSYVTIFSSQLSFQDIYLKQGRALDGSDTLVQVLGDDNSTVEFLRCEIDVRSLVVNNRPTSIRLIDSFVSLYQTRFLINAKQSLNTTTSSVEISGTLFRGDRLSRSTLPLVYV